MRRAHRLTEAIAHACHGNPPEKQPMPAVPDIVFGGKRGRREDHRAAQGVRRTRHDAARQLARLHEREGPGRRAADRAPRLNAWTGERIARAAAQSGWSPLDLRGGRNPAIHIHMRPNEAHACLSLLCVFSAQHIRMLTGGPVPPRGSAPILFMLDELPRLRHMPPVDEALNIGRNYGLPLWLFAQSRGQLQNACENAGGMPRRCAVRICMNPSGADGLDERLSEEPGDVDSVNDAARQRLRRPYSPAPPSAAGRSCPVSAHRPAVAQGSHASAAAMLSVWRTGRRPGSAGERALPCACQASSSLARRHSASCRSRSRSPKRPPASAASASMRA